MEERKQIGFARAEDNVYFHSHVSGNRKIFTKDKIYSIFILYKNKHIIDDDGDVYDYSYTPSIKELTFVDMWKIKRESNVR